MQIITIPSNTFYSDLSTLGTFPVGSPLILTNNTSAPLFLTQSPSAPLATSSQLPVRSGETVLLEASTEPYWIKGIAGPVVIQAPEKSITPYTNVDLPDDVWAGSFPNRRLQVDEEQASFQENRQFKYFESWNDREATTVSNTNQIVYRFDTTIPVYILRRKLNLWSGGREYQVYPTTGVNFSGTLGAPLQISVVNNDLRPGLASHPISHVTIRKAVGANIFTSGTTRGSNGEIIVAPSNAGNRTGSTYAPNGEKSGVAANQSFYLVLDPIGPSEPTKGQFFLLWEEKETG